MMMTIQFPMMPGKTMNEYNVAKTMSWVEMYLSESLERADAFSTTAMATYSLNARLTSVFVSLYKLRSGLHTTITGRKMEIYVGKHNNASPHKRHTICSSENSTERISTSRKKNISFTAPSADRREKQM